MTTVAFIEPLGHLVFVGFDAADIEGLLQGQRTLRNPSPSFLCVLPQEARASVAPKSLG